MARYLSIGNDDILINYDSSAQIRDYYYPYVGLENHVMNHSHKIGVYTEDRGFSWINPDDWTISFSYLENSLTGNIQATNEKLLISLSIQTAVHPIKNVYLNKIALSNLSNKDRNVKLFLRQHYNISSTSIGDTVYYLPGEEVLIYYKGKRYFLITGDNEGKSFDDYTTGIADKEKGFLGTYKDAEDGVLSKNPIEHGAVDSTLGFSVFLPSSKNKTLYYWIVSGRSFRKVKALNDYVKKMRVENLLEDTTKYWRNWLNRENLCFTNLTGDIIKLFNTSLLVTKLHMDSQGGIIASGDTSIMQFKKDHYSYVWPRDGALVVRALDRAGYEEMTQRFFSFCSKVITQDGYMLQKYRPDYSFGSTWHPWVRNGKLQLPIQEDETALVLYALWKNYEKYRDDKFILSVYDELIERPANFLLSFRDKELKLPSESYDLWEEKLGIHTFTSSTVYAGLKAAENFAREFGYDYRPYSKASKEVKEGIINYLYDEEKGYFIKRLYRDSEESEWKKDYTIDISNGYGVFEFNVLSVYDKRVENTMRVIEDNLSVRTTVGGIARYENDKYHRIKKDPAVPGNPWFISTLWLAVYYIDKAKSVEELEKPKKILQWVASKALPSGLLSEQLNPYTGEPLSATPLTWSHAAFVVAVIKYLERMEKIGAYSVFCK